MADDPRDLARELLNPDRAMRVCRGPSEPSRAALVTMLPQLAQAQKVKGELQTEIRAVKTGARQDARGVRRRRRAGLRLVDARLRRAGAAAGARDGNGPQADDAAREELNQLSATGRTTGSTRSSGAATSRRRSASTQMQFSAYPPAGSTDTEILYNQYKPFQSAWIVFLTALVVIVALGHVEVVAVRVCRGAVDHAGGDRLFGVGFRAAGADRRAAARHQHVRDGDLGVVHRLGAGFLVLRAALHVARTELGLATGRLAVAAPLGDVRLVPRLWNSIGRKTEDQGRLR